MKRLHTILTITLLLATAFAGMAQVESAGGVRRRTAKDKKNQEQNGAKVTERMQSFFEATEPSEADLAYMREIYREIDLSKPENAPLYFPEDIIDGQENLFRIMLRLVVDGQIPAYEYLDGREVFTEKYQVNVAEMLERFGIYFNTSGKKITIEEADVPTTQVLNYYVIEKWEFDKRSNRMKSRVVAVCPVLNRYGDYGGEARYPMFWVKYDQLRPFLASQYIFTSDDNNLPQYSLDDYFTMGMYKGDIYKTKNLRNLSMAQIYPDPDMMKAASDSIDARLRNYGSNLWMPSREEYLEMLEQQAEAEEAAELAEEEAEEGLTPGNRDDADTGVVIVGTTEGATVVAGSTAEGTKVKTSRSARTDKKKATSSKSKKKKKKKAGKPKYSSGNSYDADGANASAEKSVRRRKK